VTKPELPERSVVVSSKAKTAGEPRTLASVLAALETNAALSPTRKRDLRSAVKRVAVLLGNDPGGVSLDLSVISARLATISPIAAGITAKRFANLRSDFLAAAKASGVMPLKVEAKRSLTPEWVKLFEALKGRRAHVGLSRLARHASAQDIAPRDINDAVIVGFIAAVREGSLHQKPKALHRQVTLIWNEAARDLKLDLKPVSVPSFRGPPKRVEWSLLSASFRQDVDNYLSWCRDADPFATDARSRPLAPRTLKLTRDQIHAAVSALVASGTKPATIRSLADLVTPNALKSIIRRRLALTGDTKNSFNHYLARTLVRIAHEWVKVDPPILAELKRSASKLKTLGRKLTQKNKRFLRQFDDPQALRRLARLPGQLWVELKKDNKPSFRTLAKAQAALGIAILTYMPIRSENLWQLAFDNHVFVRAEAGATSTLELSDDEVKNDNEVGFDIPPHVAKMLLDYRERIAPKIIGHRPTRLFVNVDGTPKSQSTVAWLIASYARRRAGIILTSHQFRHLSAKIMLDANPGNFEGVKQLLGHKSLKTTTIYAGINTRRAALHHQQLVEKAIADQQPWRR
jgi:integrase